MRIRAECVPCQLRRVLYEVSLVPGMDKNEAMATALQVFAKHYPSGAGESNHEVSTKVKEAVYKLFPTNDPEIEVKKKSNEVALALLPEVERMVRESKNPFHTALLASVVGNVLDFGIKGSASSPEHLLELFHELFENGLYRDDSGQIKERIQEADTVLYITDNAGEIVFDKLLIQEIQKLGTKVTLMVRGEPILNDATMIDVRELGLEKVADRVMTTGCFGIGIVFSRIPDDVRNTIMNAELIIAKGMGNYESFADMELPPTAFLMRTKCQPVADDIGFPYGENIAYLRENEK